MLDSKYDAEARKKDREHIERKCLSCDGAGRVVSSAPLSVHSGRCEACNGNGMIELQRVW